MRTLIRPTGFVDSPFGHDGKVARLAGGLNWFAAVELIGIEGHVRVSTELLAVDGIEDRFDDALNAQWQAITAARKPPQSSTSAANRRGRAHAPSGKATRSSASFRSSSSSPPAAPPCLSTRA